MYKLYLYKENNVLLKTVARVSIDFSLARIPRDVTQ